MRVGKGEFPYTEVRFEWKTQSNLAFKFWCQDVLAISEVFNRLNEAGVKIAVTCVRLGSLIRQHYDLEVLMS